MGEFQEQRKYIRIGKPYIARLRVKPNDDNVTNDWEAVAVFNLSAGGIFYHSKTNLEIGTILDLDIDYSRFDPNIICVGEIVRVNKTPATSINSYAVEFTEIDEQIRKMIDKNSQVTEWKQKTISSQF